MLHTKKHAIPGHILYHPFAGGYVFIKAGDIIMFNDVIPVQSPLKQRTCLHYGRSKVPNKTVNHLESQK